MTQDTITIEVLDNGTIKTSNDAISSANHQSAESFLKQLAEFAGGRLEIKRKPGAHLHAHQHAGHWHTH